MQGTLQTTAPTLLETIKYKCANEKSSSNTSATVHTDMSPLAKIIPLLG
jgi:hypothetical protein